MSDRETIRRLAREITNELQNSGVVTDIHEARRVLEGEGNLICKRCSNPVAIQDDVCNKCGSRQGVDADTVFYKCLDCEMPISDPSVPRCPKCQGTKIKKARIVRQDSTAPYECLRCGAPIHDLNVPECPGGCGETRAVKRNHGHPSRTFVD